MSAADGIALGSVGMVPNLIAPERAAGEYTGEPPAPPPAKGWQPITSTNLNGDYVGVAVMAMRLPEN